MRAARARAERLGGPLAEFPGHHISFVPVEWGMGSDPQGFARRLREVLDQPGDPDPASR